MWGEQGLRGQSLPLLIQTAICSLENLKLTLARNPSVLEHQRDAPSLKIDWKMLPTSSRRYEEAQIYLGIWVQRKKKKNHLSEIEFLESVP